MTTPDSKPLTEPTSKLLHLPLVIVRDILEELHQNDRQSFINFRLASRACRRESEFLLFRSIALHDRNDVAKVIGFELMKRLSNDDDVDVIGEYARHLTVGPFGDEEWFYFGLSPALGGTIKGVKNLQSLTWNTHRAIEPNALQLFHKMHPSARLDVVYHSRWFTPINRALLSSPQLHTLDICIYYDPSTISGYSELQILKKCLTQGKSIKVLRLTTESAELNTTRIRQNTHDPRHGFKSWEGVTQGPFNFHWQKGDQFPALEELKLQYECYRFTPENCKMWAQIVDWSKLRKLDLNKGAPRQLFLALTNRAPNLSNLKFGIWANSAAMTIRPSWQSADLNRSTWDLHPLDTGLPILSKFFASIVALQELNFETHDYGDFMKALPVMLEHQKYNLKRLDITCIAWLMKPWKPEQFVEVMRMAPELELLKAQIQDDIVEDAWAGVRGDWIRGRSITAQ